MKNKFEEFTNSSPVMETGLCDCVKSFAPVEAAAADVHAIGVSGYFIVYKTEK